MTLNSDFISSFIFPFTPKDKIKATIDTDTKKILHINQKNVFNEKNLSYSRVDVNSDFLKYHFEKIFGKV